MITWDDGVTSESATGKERGVRRRRERAVNELLEAKKSRRLIRRLRAGLAAGAVLSAVFLVLRPWWSGTAALAVLLASLLWFQFYAVPEAQRRVEARLSGLRHVQREYDEVYARMIAEEQQ